MQDHEQITLPNTDHAIGDPFQIVRGGRYQVTVLATWGGGNITFQKLGPDGTTYLNVDSAYSANGGGTYDLPPGTYKFAVVTATAVHADVSRIAED
jgi:hypothetical protein